MTQGEINNPDALVGLTAYDRTGEKIGSVERVYLDDRTGKPGWATVKTGLFGMKETFVPLSGASRTDERLQVMYTKEAVKDAPRVEADQHLSEAEQQELYAHYGLTRPTAAGTAGAGGNRPERPAAAPGAHGTTGAAGAAGAVGAGAGAGYATGESTGRHAAGAREPAMRGAADASDKETELIRSEERLRVGVEEQEVGHAHLRKVVETEDVTTSVPLSHEEVRVVREPIGEGDAKRATIGEAETEVTLHAERAVVSKETVPVERVRLETEKVTETKEVSDTVRKERIEYDDPKSDRGAPGEGKFGRGGPRH